MNTRTTCFRKSANVVTRCIADETIIVPVSHHVADLDAIYTLNDVGTLIWECIDAHTSVDHMVEALCAVYDVSPEEACQDVADFLGSLQAAGLIACADAPER